MKIIPLSEGSFTVDKTKIFIPFNKNADDLAQRAAGSLLVEVQPFALVTENDIIVLDTGLGFSNADGVLQIHQNLLNNGIDPAKVTKVLLSHLHKDHAGGISIKGNMTAPGLSFPNASYYVSKKEMEYAAENTKSSYHQEDFELLISSPQLILLEGNEGNINNNIHFEITGGHSPYHTVFWIRERDEIIFFGGDVAPQLQQMKSRFVAKYDFDGKKSMELRSQWWKQSEEERWTLLFYHDIKTPYMKQ